MAVRISLFLYAAICGIVSLLFSCSTTANRSSCNGIGIFVLDDSLSITASCSTATGEFLRHYGYTETGQALFYREMAKAADSLAAVLGGKAKTAAGARAIIDVVYKTWNIGFDPRDTALEALLPNEVFAHKKGACLGVSLIMLMLAEKLHCPLYGVMLPGHFFCRYDNGDERFNIEPNKSGYCHPDGYYRDKYLSSNTPNYNLCNLTKKAGIGVFYYDLGTQCLKRNDPGAAIACFKESIRRCPDFAEARGNLALAWEQCGSRDSALAGFEVLFAKYPNLVNLAANYGTTLMAARQYRKALNIYQRGLLFYPSDTALLFGIARAYKGLGLKDSSRMVRARIEAKTAAR
jgi:tetratricopeptide (TPR) repeat protein